MGNMNQAPAVLKIKSMKYNLVFGGQCRCDSNVASSMWFQVFDRKPCEDTVLVNVSSFIALISIS
jgi:hypothetical protein